MTQKQSPRLRPKSVHVDSLTVDPENLNEHSPRSLEAIRDSLSRFGQQEPIIVTKAGVVVAGNGRLIAARELGWKQIRVIETELEGNELRAFAIAHNRTAEHSEFREADLAAALVALEQADPSLRVATGFDDKEHKRALRALSAGDEGVEDLIGGVDTEGQADQNDDEATVGSGEDPSYRVVVTCTSSEHATAVLQLLQDAGHRAKKVKL